MKVKHTIAHTLLILTIMILVAPTFYIGMIKADGGSSLLGNYDPSGSAYGVAVSGSIAYVADGGSGLECIDVSNPLSPTLLGSYDTTGFAYAVAVSGSVAYVSDGGSGLECIDVSNPSSPTLLGNYNTMGDAEGVVVSGSVAYVAAYNSGLECIDVSNPSSPSLLGSYNTSGNAIGVTVDGSVAYVADGNSGLECIDVSNPSSPNLLGSYCTPGIAYGVAVSGSIAYVTDANPGLDCINISDPSSPFLLGSYDTPGIAYGVAVSGSVAYVSDGGSGLECINISNSSFPTFSGNHDTSGHAYGVAISGSVVFIADDTSGLECVEISSVITQNLNYDKHLTTYLNFEQNFTDQISNVTLGDNGSGTTFVPGIINNYAVNFNGSGYLSSSYNFNNSYINRSFSFWANLAPNYGGGCAFMGGRNSDTGGGINGYGADMSLSLSTTQIHYGGYYNDFDQDFTFHPGNWYFFCLVYTYHNNTIQLWINDNLITSRTMSHDCKILTDELTIGAFTGYYWDRSNLFNGSIDDFRYFENYALNSSEISLLYHNANWNVQSSNYKNYTTSYLNFEKNFTDQITNSTFTPSGSGVSFGPGIDGDYAVDFDGNGFINTSYNFNKFYIDRSFSFWARLAPNGGGCAFTGGINSNLGGGLGYGNDLSFSISPTMVNIGGYNDNKDTNVNLLTKEWYFFCLVYYNNNRTTQLWINENLISSQIMAHNCRILTDQLTIGALTGDNNGKTNLFNGSIDDFRYFQNYALNPSDISDLYDLSSFNTFNNISALWPFENNYQDEISNINLTQGGSGTSFGTGIIGNNSVDFNGTGYLSTGYNFNNNVINRSFSFWVDLRPNGGGEVFMGGKNSDYSDFSNGYGNNMGLSLSTTKATFDSYYDGFDQSINLHPRTWYFICFIYYNNNRTVQLWINDNLTTNRTISYDSKILTDALTIGAYNGYWGGKSNLFNGSIDDFRYFENYALSPQDISALYNLRNLHAALPPSTPLNLASTATMKQITLSWKAPTYAYGSGITGYKIYKGTSNGSENYLATVGNVLNYTDDSINKGIIYYYEVSAINNIGEGFRSSEISVATTPSAPENLRASVQENQVTLYWDAPTNHGGTPIFGYKIYRGTATGSEVYITTVRGAQQFTDKNLANNTDYYYKVSAENIIGEGLISPELYVYTSSSNNGNSQSSNSSKSADGMGTGLVLSFSIVGVILIITNLRKRMLKQ